MGDMVTLHDRIPTVAEQLAIADAVGWHDHFDAESLGRSLERSLHGVVAVDGDGTAVAVGRLDGDGVRYFTVQDVLVHPEAAEQGVATRIVERLLAWVRATAPAEAIVGLFSSPEAVGVYEAAGFERADRDPIGMVQALRPSGR